MPDIVKILPIEVSNKIAAGEVVQRPSSVLKELLENSIDANSSKISVIVKNAGKNLILVIDDGDGMSRRDMHSSFVKHATSKINKIDDVFSISSMGFRGEALAAISSVSMIEMTSSKADENDVLQAVESFSSIVNEFFNSINYPHYVVFTGGISHTIWKKIRLNKINGIQFNQESKAVLMPHPKPREGTNEELKISSKNLNIKDLKNKFRPIMEPLWRWSVRTGNWSDR